MIKSNICWLEKSNFHEAFVPPNNRCNKGFMSFKISPDDLFDNLSTPSEFDYDEAFHKLCEETFPLSTTHVQVSADEYLHDSYQPSLPVEADPTPTLSAKRKFHDFEAGNKSSSTVIPATEQQPQPSLKSSLAKYIIKHNRQNSEQSQQEWFQTNRSNFASEHSVTGLPMVTSLPLDPAAKERIVSALKDLKARNAQPLPTKREPSKKIRFSGQAIKVTKAVHSLNDPRKHLPKQFFDTLNLCDKACLANFIESRCSKDFCFSSKYVGKDSPYGKNYLELIGAQAVELYFISKFASIPDGLYTMTNTSLATDFMPNGGYSVSCLFDFSGTKTISLISDQCSVAIVTHPITGMLQAHEVEGDNRAVIREIPNANIVHGVNRTGIKMDVAGKATFCINQEHRIYKVEFVHCEKKKFIPAEEAIVNTTATKAGNKPTSPAMSCGTSTTYTTEEPDTVDQGSAEGSI